MHISSGDGIGSGRPEKSAKTFSLQSSLPRLPIPDLEKSLEGYVKSLTPLLEQKYGFDAYCPELEKRKIFARDFAAKGGLGRTLQERLKDLDHISPHNWLDDTLWLSLAYHTWRAPLLVNSNWWVMFAPDPGDSPAPILHEEKDNEAMIREMSLQPSSDLAGGSQQGGLVWLAEHTETPGSTRFDGVTKREWITDWQIKKSAWMLRRFAEMRLKIQREELPPDTSRAGPFCMVQYSKLFNFARIPMPNEDHFSRMASKALHTTIMIEDFIYSMDIFQPASSLAAFPEPLSVAEIEANLRAVVDDAKHQIDIGTRPHRIGILTGDDRDAWTKNREDLLALSPVNRESLRSISDSLIVLSLDTYTLPSVASSDPLRLPTIDAQLRNVGTGIHGGRNRWYDKPITIPIETNGRSGISGEHSPVDALIPLLICDYVISQPVGESASSNQVGAGHKWKRLEWVVDEAILAEIDESERRGKALIEDSDLSALWWGEFGAEWIKAHAKQSPDAFVQQALQLAWYKEQGYATATYETASTRMMLHGRTDVIRSLTPESRDFVKAMLDPHSTDAKRHQHLAAACSTHNSLTRDSSAGMGYDRHLMGLKTRLRPDEKHALFEDEMYAKSQEWKLSTSSLGAATRFTGAGFGSAWPDGYGICYLLGPHIIKFGIESKNSCPTTSTTKFKHHLAQALRDMRRVCEAAGP